MDYGPVRERKKARTRAAVAAAALELFAERGYAGVTLAEVAAAADISPRTLFRYFADKEELLFEDAGVRTELEQALARRPSEEPAATAVREAVAALAALWQDRREEGRRRQRVIDAAPPLAARQRAKHAEYELALARALLARDLEPLPARLLARIAVACFDEGVSAWLTDEADVPEDLEAHVRRAFAQARDLLSAVDEP